MSNYDNLHKRVSTLEKLIRNEGKQVGKLYHVCTLDDVASYIAPNDSLSASGNYKNWLKGGRTDIVSFTRDKSFVVGTGKIGSSPIIVQFEVDGDLLSNNKKIFPYNDMSFDTYSDGEHLDEYQDDIPDREMEECVVGTIKKFSDFVIKTNIYVTLDLFRCTDIGNVLDSLLSCSSYLSRVKATMLKPMENRALENRLLNLRGEDGSLISFKNIDEFKKCLLALYSIIDGTPITDDIANRAFSPINDDYLLEEYVFHWYKSSSRYFNDSKKLLLALLKYRPEYIRQYITIDKDLIYRMASNNVISRNMLYNCYVKRVDKAGVLYDYDTDAVLDIAINNNCHLSQATKSTIVDLVDQYGTNVKVSDRDPDKVLINSLLNVVEKIRFSDQLELRNSLLELILFNDKTIVSAVMKDYFDIMYDDDVAEVLDYLADAFQTSLSSSDGCTKFLKAIGIDDMTIVNYIFNSRTSNKNRR